MTHKTPLRNLTSYPDVAQENGLRITDVLDTRLHAGRIAGNQEPVAHTGATMQVHPAVEAGYMHQPLREGRRSDVRNTWPLVQGYMSSMENKQQDPSQLKDMRKE